MYCRKTFWQTVETVRFLLIVYYLNFHFLPILEDMLSASCLWQIPGWCDEARNVINCSNILEAAKNLINCSLFLGIPQIFIAALYQVLIPLENCLKPKQFVFKRCSKFIWSTFERDKNAKSNTMTENAYFSWQEMLVVRIWQISISLENISSTNVLTTITSVLHFFWKPLVPIHILFKFGAKEKFSKTLFSTIWNFLCLAIMCKVEKTNAL